MSWQQKNLFSIPLWKLQIDQFGEKKKELIKMLEAYPEEKERKSGDAEKAEKVFAKDATRTFYTNRTMGPSPPDLIKKFYSIIREELENFSTKIDQQFGILDVWSLSYGQGDYHPVHNHSSMGLTGILYLDLPKDSSQYAQILTEMKEFDVLKITEEDTKRSDMYLGCLLYTKR